MLIWEEAGTAVSDGHSPTCASHVPGPRSPETCMARAGCGGRACLLSSTLSQKYGLWWYAPCPPSSETPQRGAMRRQSLILWSLRIAAHTEIIWMGATPWGCSFKVRDGPWMSKSWGKLPTPPLQRLATTTQPQGHEQPACRNLGHREQFFLLPSQKKWSRQNPYNPASVKSSCIWNTEQKDSYHISDEDIRQVTCPRGRWLTYLSGKAYGIQSSQESSTNLVSWKSHI